MFKMLKGDLGTREDLTGTETCELNATDTGCLGSPESGTFGQNFNRIEYYEHDSTETEAFR